jgi:molecular chaperone GrpE
MRHSYAAVMGTDPEPTAFDAVAAAKELDDLLAAEPGGQNDGYIAGLEGEIEDLNALIAEKDALLARANQRAEQAHAELEAAGKRIEGAAARELEQRTRKLLEGFLGVVDDLDRGIAAARAHTESRDVVEGLELVRRGLLTRLGGFGVTHASALGQRFDPRRHEAIALVPVADPAQDGYVIDVMREGYLIGDETLRPAGVAVARRAS